MHYQIQHVQVAKNQGHRLNGLAVRVFRDTQTERRKDGSDSMTSTADMGGKKH